jgi:hypothetical protein
MIAMVLVEAQLIRPAIIVNRDTTAEELLKAGRDLERKNA